MISSPQTSSSTDSANLMPPPNQVFYSYMENRRSEEEEYADIDVAEFTNMAKRMKHEGDLETVSELVSVNYYISKTRIDLDKWSIGFLYVLAIHKVHPICVVFVACGNWKWSSRWKTSSIPCLQRFFRPFKVRIFVTTKIVGLLLLGYRTMSNI